MSNYSNEESMVRVDFWKESGKWYDTVALNWDNFEGKEELIHETFKRCLNEQFGDSYRDMRATCLEPYHIHGHPISVIHGESE